MPERILRCVRKLYNGRILPAVLAFLLSLLLLFTLPQPLCYAAQKNDDPFINMPNFGTITENGLTWRNSKTGFRVVIEDDIDLLSSAEERQLLDDMIPLTEYGNAAFWSTRENASGGLAQAEAKRRELFDLESAAILVINMNLREVSIQSCGRLNDVITASRAGSITDSIREPFTRGQYYTASAMAFSQMDRLLRGERIAQPLKLLSSLCISLMIGLMLTFRFVFRSAGGRSGDTARPAAPTAAPAPPAEAFPEAEEAAPPGDGGSDSFQNNV